VTEDFFATPLQLRVPELIPSYGFGEHYFYSSPFSSAVRGPYELRKTWRFIGANENDGNRWSVGDSIDMFLMDFVNEELTENPEFILASAAALASGSIAILAAVLM
jgi:hypothetical protein